MLRPISSEKTCLAWHKHTLNIWLKRQIPSLATLDMCFLLKHCMLSFGTQAASTVNLTEGYPCVHSRTISYKLFDVTVRVNVDNTGTSLLTNLRGSRMTDGKRD